MRFFWAASILSGAVLTGCFADGQVGYRANYRAGYVEPATVVVAPPMIEIEPGIQVISDYDYPVFYSDNLYYRYDGGVWYSSRWHDRGWATSYNVPDRVRRVDRPAQYVHYRANAHTEYRPGTTNYQEPRRNEPVVRDHREEPMRREEPRREEPVVRDHREERREEPHHEAPVVRDHREEPRHEEPRHEAPVVRDHREEPHHEAPVVREHHDEPVKKRDHR